MSARTENLADMTQKLSPERFAEARTFVLSLGRTLDAALLRRSLGKASGEDVWEALAPFQNPDGGFGHGLEPDIPSPGSSALATSIGLRLLAQSGAPGDHQMVIEAVRWLDDKMDRTRGVWPIVGPDVDLAPHAPWWGWSDDLATHWNGFRFNPTAEILAHLYHFGRIPTGMQTAAEAGLRQTLAETEIIEGSYDLKCAVRLMESAGAPPDATAALAELVGRSITAHDPADVHASALDFASTPQSRFAGANTARIDAALDALVAAQAEDGGWKPFWDWSFVDAAAWGRAERDWRGQLTREALETLLAWGRVETG
jgi:hypothetical protein